MTVLNSMQCGCQKCEGGWKPIAVFLSRVFLALLFIIVGWSQIVNFSSIVGLVAAAGVPLPQLMTLIAIIFEFGGGVALLLGFHPRIAAKMLALFTLIVTLLYHRNLADPMAEIMALKNLAIMGGLLQIIVYGGGSWRIPYPKCPIKMCPDCSKSDCVCCGHCNCSTCKAP